ncbi:MAG: glycosyltransferase family 2 protein [Candidatus Hydrogenedentota bacterium]
MDRLPDSLLVVVPCYNAGQRLRPVMEKALAISPRVLVVDDGSTDGAPSALADLAVRVETLTPNRGKGVALMRGFKIALEDPAVKCIVTLDADGQHDPAELPGLYDTFSKESSDLVIGSREFGGPGVPWRSRFGNRITIGVTSWLLGRRLPDTQSGYRLHSRRLAEHLVTRLKGGRYETEMEVLVHAVKGGFKIVPSPIRTIYERGNPSSHFHKFRDSWQIYRALFRASNITGTEHAKEARQTR